jgi:hypothetical protein
MADEPTQQTEPIDPTEPTEPINQGATGSRPLGESPLSAASETDPFAERPEAFVGAAFAGGLLAALILRRFAR